MVDDGFQTTGPGSAPALGRSMKILAHIGLALLLLVSLGAVATAVAWTAYPGLVADVDARLVARHTSAIEERLAGLRELAPEDRSAAITGLEELRRELEGVEFGGRRFSARTRVLRLLGDLHFDERSLDAAMDVGDELLDCSPNDVAAPVWLGRRATAHAATAARGLEVLDSLFQRLPESASVARAYHECAIAAGDDARAADVLVRHLDRALRREQSMEGAGGVWQVWWGDGGGWAPAQRVDARALAQGRAVTVAFELPGPARQLRIDAPGGSRLAFGAPHLLVRSGGREVEVPIAGEGVTSHQMHLDRNAVITTGEPDPWFVTPLPEEVRGAPLRGRLALRADRYPLWVGAAASTDAARAAARRLPAGSRARARLVEAREQFASHAAAAPSPR